MSGIELQILKVRDPAVTTERVLDFINAALRIFPEAYNFTITFPTFKDFVDNLSFTPDVNGYKSYKSMSIDEQLEFYSSLTRNDGKPFYYQARSFFVENPYDAHSFKEAEQLMSKMPKECGIIINSEQGAIAQRRADESAYVHRGALFNFKVSFETVQGNDTDIESSRDWMNQLYESVKFLDSGRTYQNYPEKHLTDYLERYYGTNLKRLIQIKKKWDPNHFFKSAQSLPIDLP